MNFCVLLKKLLLFAITFSAASLLISCNEKTSKEDSQEIFIGNNFYYWISDENSDVQDAINHSADFKKLTDNTTKNLEKTLKKDLGANKNFVWVRAEFEIPQNMKNKMLGLVIPYLRMSEKVYLNGSYIGSTGSFPPDEQSALYKTHYYKLAAELLKPEQTNVLLIKIWSHGQSAISSQSFIKLEEDAKKDAEFSNFWNTKIYLLLVGSLFFAFIFYLILFLTGKNNREHLDFAFLNLFTMFICIPFFAPESPWYTKNFVSFPIFMKFSISIPFFWIVYFTTSFILDFEHSKCIKFIERLRLGIALGQTLITITLPDYDVLMDMTVAMLMFSIFQLCFGLYAFIRNLFIKSRRQDAIIQLLGFTPVLITIFIDLLLRLNNNTRIYPFITIFGWQISLIVFLTILSLRYALVFNQNEQLKNTLQQEINARTLELQDKNAKLTQLNEQLEKDKIVSELDLSTASIVQKKFFPKPENSLRGWDLAICYEPLSQVSGDLYDYYTFGNTLNGISLFDVSGHGISAALITMLARSIISHSFQKGFNEQKSLTSMLKEINEIIIGEKGEIDNYLTGIICRFGQFTPEGSIHVELGNAGHPYPLLYSSENRNVITLMADDSQLHFGAIGMEGINPEFATITFNMNIGDIFVCYSDGLTESVNSEGEQFGRIRLESILKQSASKPPKEIIEDIRLEFHEFCGQTERQDDITILILKRKSPSYIQLPDGENIEELPVI